MDKHFIYFDIGSNTYSRALGPIGDGSGNLSYFGGEDDCALTYPNDICTDVSSAAPGGGEAIDYRWIATGLPADQVKVQWQWKMTDDDEYMTITNGTVTIDKAEFPDWGPADIISEFRGEDDSSIWYVDSVSFGPTTDSVCDPGDADQDGDVDDDDLSLLLANWAAVSDCAHGEFSGVAPVNDDDLSLLLANWTGPLPGAVPEPATIALLIAAPAFLQLRRRA